MVHTIGLNLLVLVTQNEKIDRQNIGEEKTGVFWDRQVLWILFLNSDHNVNCLCSLSVRYMVFSLDIVYML